MTFTSPNLITNPATLSANAKAFLESELAGWKPTPGGADPFSLIIDAFAPVAAEQAEALELELIEALKGFASLAGLNPAPAVAATSTATFALEKAAPAGGFVIPAFSEVGLRTAAGELVAFVLKLAVTVPEGSTSTTGLLEAALPGEEANGLSGTAVLISVPQGVASASLAASGGGVDEESEGEFLAGLSEDLEVLKVGPVLSRDVAIVARKVPGIYRACAVNLLKPSAAHGGEGSEETNVERCVTVACAAAGNIACNSTELAAVKADLESLREGNMKFFAVAPLFEEIDVSTTVYAWPGADLTTVKEEVQAALKAKLEQWGVGVTGNPREWANTPVVRQGDLMAVVHTVPTVRWLSTLTFAKHGGSLATTNVTLNEGSSVPSLTEPGTLTITVEAST